MALLYAAAIAIPFTRDFFALRIPIPGVLLTAVWSSSLAIGGLWVSGYTLRVTRATTAEQTPASAPPGTERVAEFRQVDAAQQERAGWGQVSKRPEHR